MKIFKRVYNIVTTILLVMALILAFLLVGTRLFGYSPYTVLSGSMEPTYHVGSLIYVKDVDPASLDVKDPVTFRLSNGTVVTHRIIEVNRSLQGKTISFRTQGDANDTPDGEALTLDRVIGKPTFTIPYLGYVANYLQSPSGLMMAVSVCVILMLGMFIPDLVSVFFEKPQLPPSEGQPSAAETPVSDSDKAREEENGQNVSNAK